jgi:homopolymeric O-antigen transport system ATP-binding protein
MTVPAIMLRGVTKRFRMRAGRGQRTLKSAFIDCFRHRPLRNADCYEALRNVDFTVMRGRSVGIIGENGSGKSTLLKVIGKIYRPDAGTVQVEGRLAALIELGAGFHPEFTGRENIVINGMLMGLSRQEIVDRLDEIVVFADIGDYIEQPARTYSSGMIMRLGFSVAAHLAPDILLIDEVLAVGDEAFAKKCGERIASFRQRGKTIVLVTHDPAAVERWCDEAMWLDRGVVRAMGPPLAVLDAYHRALAQREANHADAASAVSPAGIDSLPIPVVEIVGVLLSGKDGAPRDLYRAGEVLKATLSYRMRMPASPLVFGFEIVRSDGLVVYGARMAEPGVRGAAVGEIEVTLDSLDLVTGLYFLDVAAYGPDGQPYDQHTRRNPLQVCSDSDETGVARLRHEWRVIEGAGR